MGNSEGNFEQNMRDCAENYVNNTKNAFTKSNTYFKK